MMIKTQIASHVEIEIRRQDGTMEMVRHPRFDSITDRIFGEMQSATRKAGRGEMISYRNVTKTIEMESPVADEFASSRRAIENAMTLNGRSF